MADDTTESIEQLNNTIPLLQQQIKDKDDKLQEMEAHILSLETEVPLQSKKRRRDNSGETNDEQGNLQRVTKENELLKAKIKQLEDERFQTMGSGHEPQSESEPQSSTQQKDDNTQLIKLNTQLIKLIEEKLGNGLKSIQNDLIKVIDAKLDAIPKQENQDTTPTTYASVVGNKSNNVSGNLRTIMMATKNEEITEEAARKRRSRNLIIHGLKEHPVQPEEEDEQYVNELIKDLQIGALKAKQVERLGADSVMSDKIRPLKLAFQTTEEQQKVLNNLSNLKGKEKYKGISIKEDYTFNERQLIKEYVNQAKAQNLIEAEKNTGIIWRVRGSPKNGLVLKKFTTTQRTQPETGRGDQSE